MEKYKLEAHYGAFLVTRLSDGKDCLFQSEDDIENLATMLGYVWGDNGDYTDNEKTPIDYLWEKLGEIEADLSEYNDEFKRILYLRSN